MGVEEAGDEVEESQGKASDGGKFQGREWELREGQVECWHCTGGARIFSVGVCMLETCQGLVLNLSNQVG